MNIEYLLVKLLDSFVSLDISETWRSESIYDPRKVYFPLRELEPNNEYPNIFSEHLGENKAQWPQPDENPMEALRLRFS